MGGTALGASGRSNNGLKLDVKTGKLSLWRLFPTFTFTFTMVLRCGACSWRPKQRAAIVAVPAARPRSSSSATYATCWGYGRAPQCGPPCGDWRAPLWQRWLRRAAKLWNKTLEERPGSLLQQALLSSVQLADGAHPLAQQSWAAQLAAGLAAVGMQLDLQQPAPVDLGELGEAAQRRQLAQLQEALAKGGASRLEHYVHNVVGAPNLAPAMFGQREDLPGCSTASAGPRGAGAAAHRVALGRGRDRPLDAAPPRAASLPPLPRRLLTCPLYAPLRLNFPDLFAEPVLPTASSARNRAASPPLLPPVTSAG